jgi:hypothetical protein
LTAVIVQDRQSSSIRVNSQSNIATRPGVPNEKAAMSTGHKRGKVPNALELDIGVAGQGNSGATRRAASALIGGDTDRGSMLCPSKTGCSTESRVRSRSIDPPIAAIE